MPKYPNWDESRRVKEVAKNARSNARPATMLRLSISHFDPSGAARGRQFVGGKAVDAHLRYLERDGVPARSDWFLTAQWFSSPVSVASLQKTGVLLESAGDFWEYLPQKFDN